MDATPSPLHPAAPAGAAPGAHWLVGVDGGGSGTRARLQDRQGRTLGEGSAGPSALGQGVAQAWQHVGQAIAAAFGAAGLALPPPAQIALGLGLAGAGVAERRSAFLAADPGYASCVLDTDAVTQLIGAHGGHPGIVVAAGTGSVAAARDAAGGVRLAGGWGFPVGDEGSGAWLGLRAMQHAQAVLDGRAASDALAADIAAATGGDALGVQAWCAAAGQHAYAQLAPLVFAAAARGDAQAERLLQQAADELARLVPALDGGAGDPLPVVVRGSVGEQLVARWPAPLRARLAAPAGDSADGALLLLRGAMAGARPPGAAVRTAAAAQRPAGSSIP